MYLRFRLYASIFSTIWLSSPITVQGGTEALSTLSTLPSPISHGPPTQTAPVLPPMQLVSTPGTYSTPSLLPPSPAASLNTSIATASSTPSRTPAEDPGKEYGNLVVRNNCNEPLYLYSVGSWPLGGPRDKTKGWGTEAEQIAHTIPSRGEHREPYRMTCPLETAGAEPGYCPSMDKLAGQGIAIKITRQQGNFTDILQIEYALVQNPVRGDKFKRFDFDLSQLDCGDPAKNPDKYGGLASITDVSATAAHNQIKVDACPGYKNGIALSFTNNTVIEKFANGTEMMNCRTFYCDGKSVCPSIYNFDRTREGEPSLACHQEFRGDMIVDLCAGNRNQTAGAGVRRRARLY